MGLQKGADILMLFILLLMQRTLVTSCQALTFNIYLYPFGSAKVIRTWCDFKSSDIIRLTERMNHNKFPADVLPNLGEYQEVLLRMYLRMTSLFIHSQLNDEGR